MAYEPIVQVQITISDVQVSVQGFGTPIFITAHREFADRVASYVSVADVLGTFESGSPAHIAATAVFGQTPSVNLMKIGRRDAELNLQLVYGVDGETWSIDIQVGGVTQNFTATSSSGSSEGAVDTLVAAINADPEISPQCIASENGANGITLTTNTTATGAVNAFFTVSTATNNVGELLGMGVWVGTEDAGSCWAAITEEDNDFYFVSADDNTQEFVIGSVGLARQVQSVDKLYFLSDKNTDNILTVPPNDGSVDATLFGKLAQANMTNTITMYHQDAGDSDIGGSHANALTYPELCYIGSNAPYQAGSVSWANIELTGPSGASGNPVTGKALTPTQKDRLNTRNSNYLEYDGGNIFARYGQTSGDEWIDVVRGVHWQTADITANLKALLLGQRGSKVNYDDGGIARIREVIASSLQRGVNRQFLREFTVFVPRLVDIPPLERNTRILNYVSFVGVLAGAIHEVRVNGRVTVQG